MKTGERPEVASVAQETKQRERSATPNAKATMFRQVLKNKLPPPKKLTAKTTPLPNKQLLLRPDFEAHKSLIKDHAPAQLPRDADQSATQPLVGQSLSPTTAIDRDASVIAHAAVAAGRADDLNLLIKKLTLNFSATSDHASFSIATGIFQGAEFNLVNDDHNLSVHVRDASTLAQNLLIEHEDLLKDQLAKREINLCDVLFL